MVTETDILEFPFPRENPIQLPSIYRHLRENKPVAKVRIWNGTDAWLVTRYDDVRTLLRCPHLSSDTGNPNFPHMNAGTYSALAGANQTFMNMDPPDHGRYRRLITGEFSVKRIDALRPAISKIINNLIESMERTGPPVDLMKEFANPIPALAISAMLGVPYEDHDFFQECMRGVFSAGVTVSGGKAATEALWNYLSALLSAKGPEPREDLLTRLLAYETDGTLTHEEAVSIAWVLLVGGYETTASQIGMSILILLTHADESARLSAHPASMRNAVEELLRFVNVTQAGRRRVATQDIDVRGVTIESGDAVILANDSANRDEAMFKHGDEFDLSRDARHHIAFGQGIHQCVGQRLARAELQIALETVVTRLPNLRLAVPAEELSFKDQAVVYAPLALPVQW